MPAPRNVVAGLLAVLVAAQAGACVSFREAVLARDRTDAAHAEPAASDGSAARDPLGERDVVEPKGNVDASPADWSHGDRRRGTRLATAPAPVDLLPPLPAPSAAIPEVTGKREFPIPRPADWVLARITATSDVVEPGLAILGGGLVMTTPGAARATGEGVATPNLRSVKIWNTYGAPRAATTGDLGGREAEPPNQTCAPGACVFFTSDGGGRALELRDRIRRGETATLLLFITNTVMNNASVAVSIGAGTGILELAYGTGSKAIDFVDPDATGYGAEAAGVGATTGSEWTADVPSGIVGAWEWQCKACEGTWQSPDGGTGSFLQATYAGRVKPMAFAGPAGRWRWRWTGSTSNLESMGGRPIIAGYAPIGPAWQQFVLPD